jgi:hypothetical protein
MLKVGDLVRVREGTEDFRQPDGSIGVVVGKVWTRGFTEREDVPGVVEVVFMSGENVRFHRKWLERLDAA